jgi:superkiller protein 3
LDVLDEMISLTEIIEEDAYKHEVEKRRMRLGASSPDQLRKEVFRDITNSSQVQSISFPTDDDDKWPISSPIFTQLF